MGGGRGGTERRLKRRRRAVAVHAENEAEEPRPAPTGRLARAVKLNDGLI